MQWATLIFHNSDQWHNVRHSVILIFSTFSLSISGTSTGNMADGVATVFPEMEHVIYWEEK